MATITAALVKELRDKTGAGMMDCKKALTEVEGDIEKAIAWLREKGISKAAKKADRIAADGLTKALAVGNEAVVVEINSETDFVAKNEQFLDLIDVVSAAILEFKPATLEAALAVNVKGTTINDLIIDATATIGEKITLRRFQFIQKTDAEHFGTYIHMGGKISAVAVVKGSEEIAKDMAMQVASMNPLYVSRNDMPHDEIEKEREIQVEITKNDESLAGKPEKVLAGIVEGRLSKSLQDMCLVDQPYFKDPNLKVANVLKDAQASVSGFIRYAVGEGIEKKQENFAEEVEKAAKVN